MLYNNNNLITLRGHNKGDIFISEDNTKLFLDYPYCDLDWGYYLLQKMPLGDYKILKYIKDKDNNKNE